MGWDRRVVLDPGGLARLGVAPGGAGWAGGGKRPLDFPILPRLFSAAMAYFIATGCSGQGNDHSESNPRFPSDRLVIP